MPLDLHPKCRRRLVQIISDLLPRIRILNGLIVDIVPILDDLDKLENVVPRDLLQDYIGENPVTNFLYYTLSTEFQDSQSYSQDTPPTYLTHISDYTDLKSVAESLVERFNSLPWEYTLFAELPPPFNGLLPLDTHEFKLSDKVRLVRPTPEITTKFPLTIGNENRRNRIYGPRGLLLDTDPTWNNDTLYFQITTEGFIGLGYTSPAMNARERLRSFCGIGVALGLLRIEPTYAPFGAPFGPAKRHFIVHKKVADTWEVVRQIEIEDRYTTILNDIQLGKEIRSIDREERKLEAVNTLLQGIKVVFSNETDGAPILRASQWFFDSYTGQDELLKFIQSMVVLEILLGEEGDYTKISLGELLRNRCAYLIGKSHRERTNLLEEFNQIYDVRSQIVHRGKSRLKQNERKLFGRLRKLCEKVILEEVKLLESDTASS